jgi:iron(III) transport system permease protein
MPGLVPGIHVLRRTYEVVDGRDKPGHDAGVRSGEAMSATGTLANAELARDDSRLRIEWSWLAIGGAVALAAWLALVPLVFLLWQSFLSPETASAAARVTLDNYRAAYGSADTARLFANSVQFALGSAALAFTLGAFFAWINERTDTPCKTLFFALALIPLVIPGILFTVSWIFLASPKIGIVNLVLQRLFDTDAVFVDIYSLAGMIWVDGLHYAPMAFLLMTAAFRAMDPALEESALMSGASVPQVARRVTFKLAFPATFAALLILFVRALESFEVPALLGLPVGIEVYTSAIYEAIHKYPSEVGLASAYALTLLVLTSACIYLQARVAGGGSRFATVTGKGYRPRAMSIGRWRYLTAAVFILYFAIAVVLPFLVLVWSSLQRFYSVPSLAALQNLTFDSYRAVLAYPAIGTAIWNSLVLSLGSATLIMLLASVLCWIVVRTRLPGRWLIDNLASLPLVFPGLVLGLAIMICYLTLPLGVYGTIWIMLIAYVTRFLPYGIRYTTASMLQLHKELEESAAMSGASWGHAFRRIVLPLLKPGLIAGWIYIVIVSIRELASSILLYSPGTEVVSVMIWELWQNGQYVELSALGVMMILVLFGFVVLAQLFGRRFGVAEA